MKTLKIKIIGQKVPGTLGCADNLRSLVPFVFVVSLCLSDAVYADTYTQRLKFDLKRGIKNILTSPLEIAAGFQDYYERAGWPVVRQGMGMIVGAGKLVLRLGSGVADLGAAWIPVLQKGLPVKPEVLF